MAYSKVIISLDIMQPEMYKKFKTFSNLQFKPAEEVWSYYPKTGKGVYNPTTMFNEAPIVETLLFLDYIKGKNIKPEYWYNSSLFIFNDDLYTILNGGKEIKKVDLTNTLFTSLREAWSHPFFAILQQILKKNKGKLAKPNMQTMINNGCMNKFYALIELFSQRKKFLGDFILPYNVKHNEMPYFIDFLKANIGEKIVLKYDCIQEGKGVIFKDLTKENSQKEIAEILKSNKVKGKEVLITPAYEIANEYRCYFRNEKKEKTIFSIKQRVNSSDIDVYSKENIQIYKNISAKWYEIKTTSEDFIFGSDISKQILKFLSYDTGCLEFAKTKDGQIIFFEVNQMAGPLPFEGEDTQNMTAFYHSIFAKMLS
jgi:hypothetical protein